MTSERKSQPFSAWDIALVVVMGALANILGFLAIPGPLNIKFAMTMVPVFLAAYARGWKVGFLSGLMGGIMLGLQYGFIGYALILTGVMGLVAGALVEFTSFFKKYPVWAGVIGAICEAPGDILSMIFMFGNPFEIWFPLTLKDITQDVIAAFIAVLILKNKRIQKGLRSIVKP
mgnify:CR=1 FL=1